MLQRVALPLLALLAIRPSNVVAQTSSPPNIADPSAAITATLPANVAGVLFVNTSTEAWTTLTQFQLFSQADPFLAGLPSLFLGLDLTTDVQPWLGDRAAIVLMPYLGSEDSTANSSDADAGNNPESSNTDQVLLLAPIKDASSLNAFLDKLKVSRGQVPVERQYKGITVWEWPAAKPKTCDDPAADEANCTPAPETESAPEDIPETPSETEPEAPNEPSSQTSIQTPQAFSKLKAVGSIPGVSLPPIPGGTIPIPSIPSSRPGLAIAVLPGYLVSATTAAPIEQLIDARRSNSPALATNPQFQRTLQHPQFQRSLLVGYGNIAEIARFPQPKLPIPAPLPAEESSPSQPQTALPSKLKMQAEAEPNNPAPMTGLTVGLEQLAREYSTVDGYVWLQPEGIRTQISSHYKTPQPTKADVLMPQADQILTRMPGASFLASTSRNLKQQWQSFVDITQAEPTLQPALQVIRDGIRSLSGLDLERDWLPWMDGEYAAFLFPNNQGPFSRLYPNLDLGLGLVMQTSDRPAAEAALKKFDQFVQSKSGNSLNIATRTIKGQPVTSWEFEEAGDRQSFFAHSWVDQDTLVVTTGLGPMKALNPKPYLPLDQNRTFKTATDSFARPNQGYFYTNMGASLSFIYGLFQPYSNAPEMREVKRWLGTVYSISASNSATPEKQQFDSLLVLAPTRKP